MRFKNRSLEDLPIALFDHGEIIPVQGGTFCDIGLCGFPLRNYVCTCTVLLSYQMFDEMLPLQSNPGCTK